MSATMLFPLLVALAVILLAAKLGAYLMVRGQLPAVLGELFAGIVIGNLSLLGFTYFEFLKTDPVLHALAELGVILLMFEVGLHSSLKDFAAVGRTATMVAVVGVVAPMILGMGVAIVFVPNEPFLAHIFLGATLSATSVGITARVLNDLKKIHLPESKIILGAAVIDDVLGLLVLALVSAAVQSANSGVDMNVFQIMKIILICIGFFAAAVILGGKFSQTIFRCASGIKLPGVLLVTSLTFCLLFAFLAAQAGLAPIVGAFMAGLLLEPAHYEDLFHKNPDQSVSEIIAPIARFAVPIFFVSMGVSVYLPDFAHGEIIVFAAVLSFAAIVGKQVCSLVIRDPKLDRILVGFGMIPRGEVGLIFAGIGSKLVLDGIPVVSPSTYGAVVVMVIVTTIITPFLLKHRLEKKA